MQITEQIIERIARRTFNSMFAPALRQSNVVTSGAGSSVSWADNAGHANAADTATTADSAASASAAPWAGITDKPATATRWPAWSEVTGKPDVAIQAAHNNLLAAGNEFTFASSGFSGDIWLNYRTAGGLNGAITGYTLGDGAGHALGTIIHSGNISSQSVSYATSAGSATTADNVTGTVAIANGGTGKTTAADARANLGTPALISDSYPTLMLSDGSTNNWIKIGTANANYGLLPSQSGGAGSGHNYIGTSSWYWGYAYIDNINGYLYGTGATMSGSITPNADNTLDLGSSTKRWRYIYSYGMWGTSGNALRLGGNDTTLMYLTSNGRCGIGTDSPSQKLHVSGGLAAITNNSRTVTIGAQNSKAIHIYNDNSSPFFFNGDVSSNASKTYDLGSSTYPWGTLYAAGGAFYDTAPSVHVGTSSSARISLHWAGDNNRGLYDHTGNWVVATNGTNTFLMKGNVGIGTTSPGNEKLKVAGSIYTTVGLYSEGYIDGLAYNTASDKRLKDIIDYDAVPHIDDIANAPAIHFTWKNKKDEKIHVGTIAQYWQKITPECVYQSKRGHLTMNYDVIALVNTIALAREINALKHEISELKNKAQ